MRRASATDYRRTRHRRNYVISTPVWNDDRALPAITYSWSCRVDTATGREQQRLLAAAMSIRPGYLLSGIRSGHQIDSICHMLSDRTVAVPPSAKSWTRSLAALGKTWSVITRWFRSAKTSTEEWSTRMRSRRLPSRPSRSGARLTLANWGWKLTLPDRVR